MAKPSKTEEFHESFSRENEVEGSSDRSFGLVFFGFFALVGLWPIRHAAIEFLRAHEGDIRLPALIASGVFLVVALVYPKLLSPLNKLWMKFGLLLQKIVSPIVLGIMFFLIVTPLGLIARLFGKDLLHLRWDKSARSYWISREPPGPTPDSMRHQF